MAPAGQKKYEELSVAEKLQVDFDLKATNIVLQGLPSDVYAIINHHYVAKEIWDRVKLLMQGTKLSLQEKECLAVPMFSQGDDLVSYLNKAMAFLSVVAALRFPSTNNQLITISNLRNQATIQDNMVIMQQIQGRQGQTYAGTGYKGNATSYGGNNAGGQAREKAMLAEAHESGQLLDEEQLAFLADPSIPDGQAAQKTIPNTDAFQTKDFDAYDSDCDDVSNAKAVLMANLSNYGSDVILERRIPLTHTLHIIHGSRSRNIERELVPSCFAIFTFEPLTLSLTSMPSCDLESLTNILILCLIMKALDQSL
ncbi:hypothetical protein Tco_1114024 [Tanacetum coccineum]|uniref:Integrase, catalytic region, zinc finger, CCHC-type, peptidase aspartic, catalytic n=1 Tax=Tanacetum coccineum TaxID=301880 RepID=A0ABQ5ITV6_9ASTR